MSRNVHLELRTVAAYGKPTLADVAEFAATARALGVPDDGKVFTSHDQRTNGYLYASVDIEALLARLASYDALARHAPCGAYVQGEDGCRTCGFPLFEHDPEAVP